MAKNRYSIVVQNNETGEQRRITANDLILLAADNGEWSEWLVDTQAANIKVAIQELTADYHEQREVFMGQIIH